MEPALLYRLFGRGYSATEDAHVEEEERRREEGPTRVQKKQLNMVLFVVGARIRFGKEKGLICKGTTQLFDR